MLNYDSKREMWLLRDGMTSHVLTDGMLMEQLDRYRERIMTAENGGVSFVGKLRKMWDALDLGVSILGYREGEGIIVRDKKTGQIYGRHGTLTPGDLKRLGISSGA